LEKFKIKDDYLQRKTFRTKKNIVEVFVIYGIPVPCRTANSQISTTYIPYLPMPLGTGAQKGTGTPKMRNKLNVLPDEKTNIIMSLCATNCFMIKNCI
jgi:hypothetical protein